MDWFGLLMLRLFTLCFNETNFCCISIFAISFSGMLLRVFPNNSQKISSCDFAGALNWFLELNLIEVFCCFTHNFYCYTNVWIFSVFFSLKLLSVTYALFSLSVELEVVGLVFLGTRLLLGNLKEKNVSFASKQSSATSLLF